MYKSINSLQDVISQFYKMPMENSPSEDLKQFKGREIIDIDKNYTHNHNQRYIPRSHDLVLGFYSDEPCSFKLTNCGDVVQEYNISGFNTYLIHKRIDIFKEELMKLTHNPIYLKKDIEDIQPIKRIYKTNNFQAIFGNSILLPTVVTLLVEFRIETSGKFPKMVGAFISDPNLRFDLGVDNAYFINKRYFIHLSGFDYAINIDHVLKYYKKFIIFNDNEYKFIKYQYIM